MDSENLTKNVPLKPLVAVVGADGFVGGHLAEALQAKRVVYGHCRNGDVQISQAEGLLREADVIVNAGGFRVRPGLDYSDYQRSQQGAASAFVPWIHRGALLVHISSGSVLGKSKDQKLGNQTPPNPRTFPCPAYALAKLEADQFLQRAAAESGFRLIFLRPSVLYAPQGDSMIDTLLRFAKRGVILRLYPRDARHHLCNTKLLVEVVRRVIPQKDLPQLSCLVVADPYTVTNRELETMIRRHLLKKSVTFPVPVALMSVLLRLSFHSRNPKLDFPTWGQILGVLNLDSVYDPFETFRLLGIDPAEYSLDKTLLPLIQEALQP
jgi:nucleoside-diphosphate-sugar epimerase